MFSLHLTTPLSAFNHTCWARSCHFIIYSNCDFPQGRQSFRPITHIPTYTPTLIFDIHANKHMNLVVYLSAWNRWKIRVTWKTLMGFRRFWSVCEAVAIVAAAKNVRLHSAISLVYLLWPCAFVASSYFPVAFTFYVFFFYCFTVLLSLKRRKTA